MILINPPNECPNCEYNNINITGNNAILNPYIARCSSKKCLKKIFLIINIFFGHFPNIQFNIILYILHSYFIHGY